jgi:hypothetical protein
MATANRPNRLTLDAFSDAQLELAGPNGTYSQFTNQLQTPILGAKSFELISATFINSCLQLNDQSQLMFFYYANASATSIRASGNLRCVRLHPSNFVPNPTTPYTEYVTNKYFNTVTELCAALTAASQPGGDSATFNPRWVSGDLAFSYDISTRRVSVYAVNAALYIAPAGFDDPNIALLLAGASPFSSTDRIKMNTYNSDNTYAGSPVQPFVVNQTLNPRIGFTLSINATPRWKNGNTQYGVATSTGVPQLTGTTIEADANPILLGAQSVGIYLDTVTGGGYDSVNAKNLLSPVFIEVAPLHVIAYVPASVNQPLTSVAQEIYQVTVRLVDDAGVPFVQPANYNVRIELSISY